MRLNLYIVGLFAAAIAATQAHADVISSSPFSLGYGWTTSAGGTQPWSTSETSGSNTATTIGDFSFTPTVTGTVLSSAGPTFPSRSLANGGLSAASSDGVFFQLSLAGSYIGVVPGTSPQLQINITALRIWAAGHTAFGSTHDLAFRETTAGHAATQTGGQGAITMQFTSNSNDFVNASLFTQLAWNPADYATAINNTSQTRTFSLLSSDTNWSADGFEVEGTVDLIYVPVPEPASVALLALGGAAISVRRRRLA